MGSIFSFVVDEIEEQVQQTRRQSDQCERVTNAIRGGLNPIQGGAWIGDGQRAFVQEVMTRVIPQIAELIAAIMGFGGNITSAINVITQADKMAKGVVGQLGDIFEGIF